MMERPCSTIARPTRQRSAPSNVCADRCNSVRRVVRAEDGNIAILTLVIMGFFFVIGLIAVNFPLMFGARLSAQRAADAATLAGCYYLPNVPKAEASADLYGSSAGGLNASTSTNLESGKGNQTADPTITSSGAVSELTGLPLANDRIRVDIARTQNVIGAPSWGFVDQPVGAHAVCTKDEGPMPCMIATDPGSADTFRVTQANLQMQDCGILSCSASASG